MALSTDPINVVIACDPGPIQEQIITALASQSEFKLREVLSTPDRLVRDVRAADPDILLVDQQLNRQSTLDLIDDLSIQFPNVAIVAMLAGDDPVRAQQYMLAGARAFLFQPFTQINLLNTLRRVSDLVVRSRRSEVEKQIVPGEGGRPVRTIAIYSPRGGVGCTSIAVNLAMVMKEEVEGRVLLVEGKLFFGHLDVFLNMRPQNTLADLLPHANNLDSALVNEVVLKHVSGVHVLLSPSNIQVSQGIHPDELYNIVASVQKMYEYVIIDAGSHLTENTVTLMDLADRVLLVTTPDLASLHDTSRYIQIARSLGYPTEKLLLVLNRAGWNGGVKSNDIEAAMHQQLFAQIPNDDKNALRSLNRGIPLVLRYSNSPASRAYRQIAKSLIALSTAEAGMGAGSSKDKSYRDLLLASSKLG